jgi:hypothetical protein
MKKYIFVVIAILFAGCHQYKTQKPFVIIQKDISESLRHIDTTVCFYTFDDANGHQQGFVENKNKYQIGDTIK